LAAALFSPSLSAALKRAINEFETDESSDAVTL
jgi:hypothetical protein